MSKRRKSFVNLMLGVVTCLLLVSISSPSMSQGIARWLSAPAPGSTLATDMNRHLAAQLQQAETVLLAQTEPAPAPTTDSAPTSGSTIVRYVAVMTGKETVPSASTFAFGSAGAALIGNRFVIRGDFSGLSSPLRDFATDPVNPPNPNVNSGIHVHKGEPSKNGPFQYALTVEPGADQLSGRFKGEYTLTEEQLQALSNGTLYMDLHTKQNRTGELRGIFKAY
ncbi:MAG: CHRD domain-containing protein [Lyngbya sp. HA4199-MV5]|nr:CHRD domain-containing protein [Lyngbya sp. HA4199-MV5]